MRHEIVWFEKKEFREHELKCPDCGAWLRLLLCKKEEYFDPTKVFYGCSGFPGCDTTHPANYRGDPVGELVVKPLREARRKAWELYTQVISSHGIKKASQRLTVKFGVKQVSQLNRQQCEELIFLIHQKNLEARG